MTLLNFITAIYATILFWILEEEEECTLICIKEVEVIAMNLVTALFTIIQLSAMVEEWLFIIISAGGGSIEFCKCSIYNNVAQNAVGGMYIDLYEGGSSIEFGIFNNIAQPDGGGVYIDLYDGGGSIELHKCTVYSNIVRSNGGGVYIDLYKGGGSIEIGNCTIHDNAAYIGSGLFSMTFKLLYELPLILEMFCFISIKQATSWLYIEKYIKYMYMYM